MRRILLAAVLVPVAAAAAPTTATAAVRDGCNPSKSRTLDATRSVRIYNRGFGLFACAYRTGRPIALGEPIQIPCSSASACGDGVGVLGISGRYVVTKENVGSLQGVGGRGWSRVVLWDTIRRRRAVLYETRTATDAPTHGSADVLAAQVAPTGHVAFIVEFYWSGSTDRQVRVAAPSAGLLVDSGPGVDAASLARAGNTIFWMHDGSPRTAQLTVASGTAAR
jgi:hypothetical protein